MAKVPPIHVHVHIDIDGVLSARLERLETAMSELTDAVAANAAAFAAMSERIDADVAHLQDLLQQALDANTEDAAERARLTQEASDVAAGINAQTAVMAGKDPDPNFPAAPPVEEPPVEEPPVDGGGEPAPPV